MAPYVNTSQTVWFKFLILASVYLGLKVLMWFNLIYAILTDYLIISALGSAALVKGLFAMSHLRINFFEGL